MNSPACLITVVHAPSDVRGELHTICGLEWMDLNVAFENGQPLPLRFELRGPTADASVARVRALVDIAHRHSLELKIALEHTNGLISEATPDDFERLVRELRGRVVRGPLLLETTDIRDELQRLIVTHGLQQWTDSLVALARPFLAVATPPIVSHDSEIPIGASKLWGLPDLPPGTPWPRQKNCTSCWEENVGMDPEGLCGFVAQLSLSELAGANAASLLPKSGLLSIFAFTEYERFGTVDAFVPLTHGTHSMQRTSPPAALDEANALRNPVALHLLERPSIPEMDSPHFDSLRAGGVDKSAYRSLLRHLGNTGLGFLGYGYTPTAGDITESVEWHQLARLETSSGWRMDLQLHAADFAAGRPERTKLVYAHPH